MDRVGAHVHHIAARFEVSVVTRDMQWSELVGVLEVEGFLGERSDAKLEVLYYVVILPRLQQMLKIFDQE